MLMKMGLNKKCILIAIVFNLVSPIFNFKIADNVTNDVTPEEDNLNRLLKNSTIIGRAGDLQACDCGWRNSAVTNIVGGDETGTNEFPGMAGVINLSTGYLLCGSIIISDRYLLTAGHCVYQKAASTLAVLVGDHNISSFQGSRGPILGFLRFVLLQDSVIGTPTTDTPYSALYYVNAYEINPGYVASTYENDIAILQTKTLMTFSYAVAPICLPFRYSTATFANQAVIIMGWGQIEFSGPTSEVLLRATLGVLSNSQCAASQGETISAGEICTYAYGKDSCQSDSGGPVLWTDTTTNRMHSVGIISHGVGCASAYPGINTRVTTYLDWILARTSDASYCYM